MLSLHIVFCFCFCRFFYSLFPFLSISLSLSLSSVLALFSAVRRSRHCSLPFGDLLLASLSEEYDEKYDVDVFNNMEELEEFRARFRLSSVQIQDHDCKLICQVVEVLNEEHKFKKQVGGGGGKKKKKKSVCTYVVTWQHGPLVGQRTFAKITDICLNPFSKEIDPSLFTFLRIARERIEEDEQRNFATIPDIVEVFFQKLRRLRNNRFASRTVEGRLNGHCKRIELPAYDLLHLHEQ
ncbi:uncharacterized protein LOC8283793 isoform X2 [Ricinus communis]|uniref:uncharacterized protein LOC8283793 isoform X2 n=1 Tax=Ricinus communis TaxID=3988 RepID=UPI0007724998|nr:uncharacterized protein LOC8283793 isoform X2 [Ricinus communis]|eukprot:XP_015578406.1 uncharacterized protein LOC8283793 isoform X2 [Ricinus communis]